MSLKKRLKKRYKLILVILFFLFLVIINPKQLFTPLRYVTLTVLTPFERVFFVFSSGAADGISFLQSIGDLKQKNEDLQAENQALKGEIASLSSTQLENEELRKQLDLLPQDKFVLENSLIIGYGQGWITIQKGKKDGIEAGMPVIIYNGILVGRVDESNYNNAKITLINNPENSVNAQSVQTKAKGIVKGNFSLGLTMEMINQADPISTNDTIVTSGLGGSSPQGLLIGTITEVKESPDGLFKQAILTSPIDFSKLKLVSIIKNEKL